MIKNGVTYSSFLISEMYPKILISKNTNLIDPLSGRELANELKKNHIYLTASINEPSGNHHIEASQCGLPVLYLKSGGIPEYCKRFWNRFRSRF